MITFVLDACVAAKWALPPAEEEHTTEALRLLQGFLDERIRFLVPDLFWTEFGNVLWKAVRRGRCSRLTALEAIRAMRERNLPTVPSARLLTEAFEIAHKHDRSVYDSVYVALAVTSRSHLITADRRLFHALAAHFPVKWLGAV